MWQQTSVHLQPWPKWEEKHLVQDEVEIVVQINGRKRAVITVLADEIKDKDGVIAQAKKSDRIQKYIDNKKIKREIYVQGKLVNLVV